MPRILPGQPARMQRRRAQKARDRAVKLGALNPDKFKTPDFNALNTKPAQDINQTTREMFESSSGAHQSGQRIFGLDQAIDEFQSQRDLRYAATIDEKGNPRFGDLQQDLDAVNSDIQGRILLSIDDKEVAQGVRREFQNYYLTQKLSTLGEAAEQQVAYAESALKNGLDGLAQKAASDQFEQIKVYESQAVNALTEARNAGLITSDELALRIKTFQNTVRQNVATSSIRKNPERAQRIIPELQLDAKDRRHFEEYAVSATAVQAAKQLNETQRSGLTEAVNVDGLVQEAKTSIKDGSFDSTDLAELHSQMPRQEWEKINKLYQNRVEQETSDVSRLTGLSNDLATKGTLAGQKPKDIESYYQFSLDSSGVPPEEQTLEQRARVAGSLQAPVQSYAKQLQQFVKNGPIESAEDTLNAYKYITDTNSPTLAKGFDRDALAIMEQARLLSERGGLGPQTALSRAREKFSKITSQDRKEVDRQFRRLDEFKSPNIEETAATALDAESFFGTNRIAPDAVKTFKTFAQDGYRRTGSKETAIAYATNLMKQTHGESSVTSSKQLMFLPPEKAYPGIPAKALRSQLLKDTAAVIPSGVSADNVSIRSDILTNAESPSWAVTYKKTIDGVDVTLPLMDSESGLPLRWIPRR